MNGTKKTLTTLTAAAALAIGGIAIAQSTDSSTQGAGASLGSSSTMQNSGDQSLGTQSTTDQSLNSSADTGTSLGGSSDTSTLGASSDTSTSGSAPQMDRN